VLDVEPATIACSLALGEDYRAWLEDLTAIGAPPDGVKLPRGDQAAALLTQLGLEEHDRAMVLSELPSASSQPELWWLLERAYRGVVLEIGQPDGGARRPPALPTHLGAAGRLFWVFVYLAAVEEVRAWHRQRGISDAVSWDTLADLGRQMRVYRRRTQSVGLDTQWWLSLHFRGGLFALGRLQFNPFRLLTGPAGPEFWYDAQTIESSLGDGFRQGDPVLGVHIPESGPLNPSACDESLAAASEFFDRYLPEHSSRIAICTSWLLDDQLADYLDPDSNIVRFQRRFELVPGSRAADNSPFHFVFGKSPQALSDIVPRTRLEHALVRHLAEGGHWRMRTGWLRLP
jgi:hypothetical protein